MAETFRNSGWAVEANRRARQAVVAIQVQKTKDEFSTGSGFVIDRIGHIITNMHVVADQVRIVVEFHDGTREFAILVGCDSHSDIAVIQVKVAPRILYPIAIGDSDELVEGQPVLAIGHPFGHEWSLTSGIISGMNRALIDPENVYVGGAIQTSAVINPGNSGGPLVNSAGEVIGVNTAGFFTEDGGNTGTGYAVPAKLAYRVANTLISEGSVKYSYSGMTGEDLSFQYVDAFHLPSDLRGVLVTGVSAGSPAAECGLQECVRPDEGDANDNHSYIFDVVAAIDGYNVKGFSEMLSFLDVHTRPGQEVILTVLRLQHIDEVTRVRVRSSESPYHSPLQKANRSFNSYNYFGFTALEITDETIYSDIRPIELSGSLLLLEVKSNGTAGAHSLQGFTERKLSDREWERAGKPAHRFSPETRDIITEIDGIPLGGMWLLNKYIEQVSLPGEEVIFTVRRYRDNRYWARIPMTLGYR